MGVDNDLKQLFPVAGKLSFKDGRHRFDLVLQPPCVLVKAYAREPRPDSVT